MALYGDRFLYNVLNCVPCSSNASLRRLSHLSSYNIPKQNTVASNSSYGIENQRFLPSQFQLKQREAKSLRPCQVKRDDTEEIVSGESILISENTLKQDLEIAIEEENYAEAAKIRDSLRALHDDSKGSVLATNARFYESFKNGDLAAMQGLWAKGDNVCCVHPGANGITGYELVMESWEVVWMNYEFPLNFELKDVRVHVEGDVGYVTCMEFVKTKGSSWGAQFATNVFERIDGQWFICVHHASPFDL